MFGKPEWFVPKRIGWGLTPVTWQGWVYALVWGVIIAAPFVGLLLSRGVVEAIIWMAAAMGFLIVDVRIILRGIRDAEEAKAMLRIMEQQETRGKELSTDKFDLHITDSDA